MKYLIYFVYPTATVMIQYQIIPNEKYYRHHSSSKFFTLEFNDIAQLSVQFFQYVILRRKPMNEHYRNYANILVCVKGRFHLPHNIEHPSYSFSYYLSSGFPEFRSFSITNFKNKRSFIPLNEFGMSKRD